MISAKALKKYQFHSFTQKPTFSLTTHMQINYTIQAIDKIKDYINSIPFINTLLINDYLLPISIVSASIRIMQLPSYYLIKSISYNFKLLKQRKLLSSKYLFSYSIKSHKNLNENSHLNKSSYNSFKSNNVSYSTKSKKILKDTYLPIIEKLFIKDLIIDLKQTSTLYKNYNNIDYYNYYKKFYSLELLLSYLLQVVIILNHIKAIGKFEIFRELTFTSTILPNKFFLIVFISNYFFIKESRHPYLINLTNSINLDNKLNTKLLFISFAFSIPALFFSKYACASWVGYNLMHVIISKFNYKRLKTRVDSKSIQNYYLNKKSELDSIRNKFNF